MSLILKSHGCAGEMIVDLSLTSQMLTGLPYFKFLSLDFILAIDGISEELKHSLLLGLSLLQ